MPPEFVDDRETLHRALIAAANPVRDGRVHYMAFFSSREPWRMSVDRADYRPLDETLRSWGPTAGVASLEAGPVRAVGVAPPLDVLSVPENDNDAHAEITASDTISKNRMKTKVCKQLAALAAIVVKPSVEG